MPTPPQDGADRRTQLAADGTLFAAKRTYEREVRTGRAALASLRPTDGPVIRWRPSRPAGARANCS
jgi:hypothetical protein